MTNFKSDFLTTMEERGFIQDCTDLEALDKLLCEGPQTAYIGFDPTATSLHIGNLSVIMILHWWQKTGNKPIILLGGGTAMVGDPSGKDEGRKLLTEDAIAENIAGLKGSFARFVDFDADENSAIMVNNSDWLHSIKYIDFLRNYGQHFSVNRMLSFDSVKSRLDREQPLSFLEFNYMILQGYDFVELSRNYNCRVQMGGSDQWGNILNGTELGRRVDGKQLFGLVAPLITTPDGKKMGKTAKGAAWLNADLLSPYDYWQYWRNVGDEMVGVLLRRFTDLPMDEVKRLESLEGAELNQAKIILANETTTMLHGKDAAKAAEETAKKTFAEGGGGADLPTISCSKSELTKGIDILDLYIDLKLTKSKGEAKRLIKQGGARINGIAFKDMDRKITLDDINDDDNIKLSAGKKRHGLVCVN